MVQVRSHLTAGHTSDSDDSAAARALTPVLQSACVRCGLVRIRVEMRAGMTGGRIVSLS
jgi:hypothetical protein